MAQYGRDTKNLTQLVRFFVIPLAYALRIRARLKMIRVVQFCFVIPITSLSQEPTYEPQTIVREEGLSWLMSSRVGG